MAHLPFLKQRANFADYPEGIETLHQHAEKALKGVRPFDTSRIRAWSEHLPRVRGELEANPMMRSDLVEFGYEENENWAQCLTDVVPLTAESYKEAGDRWPKKWEIAIRYWLRTKRYLRQRGA